MQEHVSFARANSRWNQAARWFVFAGIVGPLLYAVVFTLAGFLRPGYSPVRQSMCYDLPQMYVATLSVAKEEELC